MERTFPLIDEVVTAYIICGNNYGFAIAETILARFTPDQLEGRCHDIPHEKRAEAIEAFKNGMEK